VKQHSRFQLHDQRENVIWDRERPSWGPRAALASVPGTRQVDLVRKTRRVMGITVDTVRPSVSAPGAR